MKLPRGIRPVLNSVIALSLIGAYTLILRAECNRIAKPNTQIVENTATCTKTITYHQKCEAPVPDDWTKGCNEGPGLVRQETYFGIMTGWKFSFGICGFEFSWDCRKCLYPSSPSTTTMVNGTVAYTYSCGH